MRKKRATVRPCPLPPFLLSFCPTPDIQCFHRRSTCTLDLEPAVILDTWSQRTFSAMGRKVESSAEMRRGCSLSRPKVRRHLPAISQTRKARPGRSRCSYFFVPPLAFHAVRRRIPQTAEHGSSRCSMLEKVARAIANFVRRDAENGRNIAARHAPRFDELRIFVGHAQNLRHHAHCHIFERAYNVDSPVLLLPLIHAIGGF